MSFGKDFERFPFNGIYASFQGCQFREHSVLVDTDRERAILAIAQLVGENYALSEQPPLHLQELAAAGEISPNWLGISLTPQRCRQGLLPQLCMDSGLWFPLDT